MKSCMCIAGWVEEGSTHHCVWVVNGGFLPSYDSAVNYIKDYSVGAVHHT